MTKGRLEAFSDGVIAIIITITILLIDLPEGNEWADLMAIMPLIGCYLISFILVGTNWVNHHHLLQVTQEVNGKVLWANLLFLFLLSFAPVSLRMGWKIWLWHDSGSCVCSVESGVRIKLSAAGENDHSFQ